MKDGYSIGFFGDFTTGENYALKSDRLYRKNVLRQCGYDYLFKKVKNLLTRFDINILNLETPLTHRTKTYLADLKQVCHWADPDIVPKYLKKYNVKAVSLGNNHGMDYEQAGLEDTFEALEKNKIEYFGAGLDFKSAMKPFKMAIPLSKKNLNLYVIGGYKYRQDYEEEFYFYAKENKAGVNLLTPKTAKPIIEDIKSKDKNSFVVMFPHFGFDLYKTTDMQRQYAHSFIDAGADCVIGHGPHMLNSIETYKDKTILYGIGNFIFPARFERNHPYNLVAELKLYEKNNKVLSKIFLYPIYSDIMKYVKQTRPIKEDEALTVLSLITENSNITKNNLDVKIVDGLVRIEI